MSPLDHYREAERLLEQVARPAFQVPESEYNPSPLLAAQVHATLANAHMTAGVWDGEEK